MSLVKTVSVATTLAMAVGAFAIAAPASAKQPRESIVVRAEPGEFISRSVSYRDINLLVPAGVNALNGRVRSAVTDVCTEATFEVHAYFRCEDTAWIGARPQIDRAIARAREVAMTGSSTIAASAIVINISN